jgi:hypothetical protein
MAIDPKLMAPSVYKPQLPAVQAEPKMTAWERFKNAPSWVWGKIVSAFTSAKEGLLGKEGSFEQVPNFDEQTSGSLNFLLSDALQNLQNPNQGFEAIENETRRGFHERTIPAITEQFQGGRLSSPVFASQLASAGQGLDSVLAAQKAEWGQRNRQLALNQFQVGAQPRFTTQYHPGSEGLVQQVLPIAAKAGVAALTGGVL